MQRLTSSQLLRWRQLREILLFIMWPQRALLEEEGEVEGRKERRKEGTVLESVCIACWIVKYLDEWFRSKRRK